MDNTVYFIAIRTVKKKCRGRRFRTHDLKSPSHWSVNILLTDEQEKSKHTTKIIFFKIMRGRFIMELLIRVLS